MSRNQLATCPLEIFSACQCWRQHLRRDVQAGFQLQHRLCACRSASPGKLGEFEEELFRSAEMSETPVVMAVTVAMVEGARMVCPARTECPDVALVSAPQLDHHAAAQRAMAPAICSSIHTAKPELQPIFCNKFPWICLTSAHPSSFQRQVGVAFSDAALRRLGACEFADDEHFCNLEAVTTQLGAKECVMPKARCLPVLTIHHGTAVPDFSVVPAW